MQLSGSQTDRAVEFFHALSNEKRISIIMALCSGSKCVNELVEATGFKQPSLSQHLAILNSAGLVRFCHQGNSHCYTLTEQACVCRLVRIAAGIPEGDCDNEKEGGQDGQV